MKRYPNLLSAAVVLAAFTPLVQAASVVSAPYGVVAADVPNGSSGLSFPLIVDDLHVGRVVGNTADRLTLEGAPNIGSQLTMGVPYYAEVLDGALEGERMDVLVSATKSAAAGVVVFNLTASSHSTLATLPANALAQSRVVVRPHFTLEKLQTLFTPGLVGSNTAGNADLVKLFGPKGFTTYHLRGDNRGWREVGRAPDVRNGVIAPGVSVLLQLRSGAKRWVHAGGVRTNALRKNLKVGQQGFATGFPVSMTPSQIAAFVDAGQPAGTRWVGSENPDDADMIRVFDPALNDYRSYFLRADGVTWSPVGDLTTNVAHTPILTVASFITVARKQADNEYLVLQPVE